MKEIPLIKINNLIKFCSLYKKEALTLIDSTRKTFGALSNIPSYFLFPSADNIAKKWLIKSNNPYKEEIKQYSNILNVSGVYALNLSYEWGCTSGAFKKKNHSPDMLRVLDWPFLGLGETLFVVHQTANAGDYYNVTWPAISGVFQAMAPDRFSAAINQAPMKKHGLTLVGDWLKNRKIVFKQNAITPHHLLRQVFENAQNYSQAKKTLMETPICIPVIYILTGTKPNEACIIERLEDQVAVRELSENPQVSVSNHFQSNFSHLGKGWRARAIKSHDRAKEARVLKRSNFSYNNFNWLSYPIVNSLTRLCMIANAKNKTLVVQGWNRSGPVTKVFSLKNDHSII